MQNGTTIPYPPQTDNLHYEIKPVVAIGKGGKEIAEADALDHVWGYGVDIDRTRRDIQEKAKEMGRPWDMARGLTNRRPARRCARPRKSATSRKASPGSRLMARCSSVPETISYLGPG